MSDELTVSSTTDVAPVVEAVAIDQPEAARAFVGESALANFEQSADGKVVSYENPSSERAALLQHLSELEAEVELPVESYKPGQPIDEATLGVDMDAVRRAATEDAIQAARWQHQQAYQQQPQQELFSPQPQYSVEAELQQFRAKLAVPFGERMQELLAQAPDRDTLEANSNVPISMEVQDALLALPGGPEAVLHLIRHPAEARELQRWPEHVQVAKVAHLMARLTEPPRRQRSNAPPPISPVGGSSVRSSLSMDELSYSDYRAARERQIKSRRGR